MPDNNGSLTVACSPKISLQHYSSPKVFRYKRCCPLSKNEMKQNWQLDVITSSTRGKTTSPSHIPGSTNEISWTRYAVFYEFFFNEFFFMSFFFFNDLSEKDVDKKERKETKRKRRKKKQALLTNIFGWIYELENNPWNTYPSSQRDLHIWHNFSYPWDEGVKSSNIYYIWKSFAGWAFIKES